MTAPDGGVTTTGYDADRQPLSVTGPTGAVTDATYDYMGRLLTSTQVERSTGSGTAAYTTDLLLRRLAGPAGGGGWLSQQTSPDGVSTSYAYDPAGEVTSVTDGAGDTTSYAYDALGRKTKVTYPDGTATATGYDGAGNPVSVQQLDASGTVLATTSAAYDGEGDQLSATDAAGQLQHVHLRPDRAGDGRRSSRCRPPRRSRRRSATTRPGTRPLYTDGNGSQWWDTYNSWGLQESRVEPSTAAYTSAANSTFTTAYDADGNPVTLTEPGGVTITSTYNNVGELTGQSGTGADAATATRTFGYDLAGRPDVGVHVEHAGHGLERDERVVHLQRPRPGADRLGVGRVDVVRLQRGRAGHVGRRRGRDHRLHLRQRRPAGDPGQTRSPGRPATYSYNADSQVTGISYGIGQGHAVVRLRRPAPADLRHAQDRRRGHRRVARLRVQRQRRAHLRGHQRAGRAGLQHATPTTRRAG